MFDISTNKNDNFSNEQLFDDDVWNNKNSNDTDSTQYYKKYKLLKLKYIKPPNSIRLEKTNNSKFIKQRRIKNNNYSNHDNISNIVQFKESSMIKEVNSINNKKINIQIPKNSNNNVLKKQMCITMPEEYYSQKPNFIDSIPYNFNLNNNNNTQQFNNYMLIQNNQNQLIPRLNHQNSYISTHTSSKIYLSKDTSIDENESYLKGRILTNESNKSNKSSNYMNTFQNISKRNFWPEEIQRRVNSSSFTEGNYYNAFSINTSSNFFRNQSFINNNKLQKQLINLENIALGKEKRTTLMIRNIPIKYTDEMLLKELEKFVNKFNCLYMPYDFEKKGNRGYAFINFINPLHILLFYEKFQGKIWSKFESKKICELNLANFQGISEIKKHAKNYKGLKKPSFFIVTDNNNNGIEVPKRYLSLIQVQYKKLNFKENKEDNTIIINSF